VQACASLLGATAETASQDPSEEVSLDSVDAGTGTDKFGIVTTGSYWEPVLTRGVTSILRSLHLPSSLFSKVVSTGLSAAELHTAPKEDVERRMIEATKRLLEDEKVQAVCLGCAGMAGMEVLVRRACVETRGEVEGGRVHVVDGILAGVDILVEGFERR
jgi:Asp/Glu/hydantoin racemase